MPNPRRALPFEQWPAVDQAAWTRATTLADPLRDPGAAAHWRPKTLRTVFTRYGLWLASLLASGQLDPCASSPASRATRICLAAYLQDLRDRGLAPVTIAGCIRDLREALRVMERKADLAELDWLLPRLNAVAEPVRVKRLRVVSPILLLDAAIRAMTRLHNAQQRKSSRRTAERYRDALIVAFLATRPVRLENLTAIEILRHLTRRQDAYWCCFAASETKEGQALEFPMPAMLTVWLDRYLEVHRPLLLLRGGDSARLWISIRAAPIVANTIYCRVVHATEKLIGHAINPHLFRDCVATFIAEQASGEAWIIARILGHATMRSSEQHYNQAGMLSAQRRYLAVLERQRGDVTVSS